MDFTFLELYKFLVKSVGNKLVCFNHTNIFTGRKYKRWYYTKIKNKKRCYLYGRNASDFLIKYIK